MFFLNCEINISEKVFRPRLETEYWVKKAIAEINSAEKSSPLNILDIFSGTGCIGIAALKNIEGCRVDFADISKKALKQIRENLKINKIPEEKYSLYGSNLFKDIKPAAYDIIFANPPYVAESRIFQVQKTVLETDPRNALFAGKDGMFYIRKFLGAVGGFLKEKGIFFMEFDPLQKKEIERVLKNKDFISNFRKDQFKKYRWLKAEKV